MQSKHYPTLYITLTYTIALKLNNVKFLPSAKLKLENFGIIAITKYGSTPIVERCFSQKRQTKP